MLKLKPEDRDQIATALSKLALIPAQGAVVQQIIDFLLALKPEEPKKEE